MDFRDHPPDAPALASLDGGIARIVLNRPDSENAIDMAMAHALGLAVARCKSPNVRVVTITGSGSRFCVGGDVSTFLAERAPSTHIYDLATVLDAALRALAELRKPVVCGVQGAVAGAGLGFVLASDLVIAARNTKFATAFAGIGLTPDSGVSYMLPRAIGSKRALEMTLLGRVITAEEAKDWGLVTHVVDDPGTVTDLVEDLALRLASGPTKALGESRRLLRAAEPWTPESHAEDEAATISASVTTSDAQARIAGFLSQSQRR